MKHLRPLFILLLVCSWLQTVRAQAADSWVDFSPEGEQFMIKMPESRPVKLQQNSFDQLKVETRIYTATSNGVDYTVWSLTNEGYAINGLPDNEAYLDACADLVWESLLKPLRDQVPKKPKPESYMSYASELESGKLPPGREYTITLGFIPGLIRIYVAGQRIYVLTVKNADPNNTVTHRFLNSFGLKIPSLSVVTTDRNLVIGKPSTGTGDSTSYNRTFTGREVTEKARVLSKPEPQYTESARKYSVQGTVVLHAVFSSSGQVSSIRAVQRLPHGLTQRAIGAARNIKFIPATKDGHPVSMYIQLEYNFNLY
jgi:TonB family protein